MQQARIGPDRPHGRLVDMVGRPPGRPTCTAKERSTARSIVVKERSTARSIDCMIAALCWCRSTGWSTEHKGGSTGRSTDRRVSAVLSGFEFLFWFGIESDQGFLKPGTQWL